jgi:hypothetical protein
MLCHFSRWSAAGLGPAWPMIIYRVDSQAAWWWWSPGKINLIIINIMVKKVKLEFAPPKLLIYNSSC